MLNLFLILSNTDAFSQWPAWPTKPKHQYQERDSSINCLSKESFFPPLTLRVCGLQFIWRWCRVLASVCSSTFKPVGPFSGCVVTSLYQFYRNCFQVLSGPITILHRPKTISSSCWTWSRSVVVLSVQCWFKLAQRPTKELSFINWLTHSQQIITLTLLALDSVWLICLMCQWIKARFRELRWHTSSLHTLFDRYAHCLKKAIENGLYFWSMRWSCQTTWSVSLDSSSFQPFHDVRTIWNADKMQSLQRLSFLHTTVRFWDLDPWTRPLPHPVCSSLSGPCRPGSKQGKVSVMYCIQEFLSDHTDVLVILVDVDSRTL